MCHIWVHWNWKFRYSRIRTHSIFTVLAPAKTSTPPHPPPKKMTLMTDTYLDYTHSFLLYAVRDSLMVGEKWEVLPHLPPRDTPLVRGWGVVRRGEPRDLTVHNGILLYPFHCVHVRRYQDLCFLHVRWNRENLDLFCFSSPPSLVSMNILWPPGARAIFLHSNVLYNNIEFVTGCHKKHWGVGDRIDPKNSARSNFTPRSVHVCPHLVSFVGTF